MNRILNNVILVAVCCALAMPLVIAIAVLAPFILASLAGYGYVICCFWLHEQFCLLQERLLFGSARSSVPAAIPAVQVIDVAATSIPGYSQGSFIVWAFPTAMVALPVAAEPVALPVAAEPVALPVAAEPVALPVAAEPVAEPVVAELTADMLQNMSYRALQNSCKKMGLKATGPRVSLINRVRGRQAA